MYAGGMRREESIYGEATCEEARELREEGVHGLPASVDRPGRSLTFAPGSCAVPSPAAVRLLIHRHCEFCHDRSVHGS